MQQTDFDCFRKYVKSKKRKLGDPINTKEQDNLILFILILTLNCKVSSVGRVFVVHKTTGISYSFLFQKSDYIVSVKRTLGELTLIGNEFCCVSCMQSKILSFVIHHSSSQKHKLYYWFLLL